MKPEPQTPGMMAIPDTWDSPEIAAKRDALMQQLTEMQRQGLLAPAIDHFKSQPATAENAAYLKKVTMFLNNCGIVLYRDHKTEDALACFALALRAQEDCAPALNNAATCLRDLGRLEESDAAYRGVLVLRPDLASVYSNLLFNLHYHDISPQALAATHREWDDRYGAGLYKPPAHYANNPQPERTLKVGFVSPDLGNHPVGTLLVRILENIDHARMNIICYSTGRREDAIAERIRRAADTWHDVQALDNNALAQKIREDGTDILIDLSGHSGEGRPALFARKPAPVQAIWIGYPGDSGLAAMDYVIADRFVLPDSRQPTTRAKILHLPYCFVCFDPPANAPEVAPLPATVPGAVRIGSFHNPIKINAEVIALWSAILKRLPRAKIVFKYRGYEIPSVQQMFRERFAAHGISPAQLEFEGSSPLQEMFAAMNRLDLMLDPFPFAAGMMALYALWMGVPLISLPGESFASRQSLSFLSVIGITDTIAASPEEYVEKAVALAQDLPCLAEMRHRLRPAMQASPLCDGRKNAEGLENLLRQAWRTWCVKTADAA
jgi:predicted O-linked N-acetylglucosamine transferase (SPINDLY family)